MEAIETGNGKLDTGASLVKCLASLLVVSSGSAIGREGAMILLAALVGSLFAQRFTHEKEWKLWVACAAAAGMASAYRAAGGQPVYRRDPVRHPDAGLARPGGDRRGQRPADDQPAQRRPGAALSGDAARRPLPTQYLLMALVGVVAGAGGPLFYG